MTTFLFGTRLTNVTRAVRQRDPDEALAACSANVADWSGGTRIASSCGHSTSSGRAGSSQKAQCAVDYRWARTGRRRYARLRDRQASRSCRRLIWFNPLLRFHAFEARAKGVQKNYAAAVDERVRFTIWNPWPNWRAHQARRPKVMIRNRC